MISEGQTSNFIDNIRKFTKLNKFQAGITGIWANLFASKEELDRLKELFNRLDKEKTGTLSRENIENGIEELEKLLGKRSHDEGFDAAKGLVCN
jgi:hypothetical protein